MPLRNCPKEAFLEEKKILNKLFLLVLPLIQMVLLMLQEQMVWSISLIKVDN